jgi:PrtD family type I secretion system ABC transporter
MNPSKAAGLGSAMRAHFPAVALIALFSVFVNLLNLTGPLFMLQVYDRVLASRSEPTLVALFLLVVVLFGAMALLDLLRSKIGARIGARLQSDLDERVFQAAMVAPSSVGKQASTALYDLEAVRKFLGSPAAFAFLDLPFTPLFLSAIFLFHWLLGWLAIAGGVVLVALMLANQIASRKPSEIASQTSAKSTRASEQVRLQAETVRGLGMTGNAIARWRVDRDTALAAELSLGDSNGGFGAWVKGLRMLLQSAMLALGAWVVIRGEMSGGAMIAGSILMGRALAPIEQLVGSWSTVVRASKGWKALRELLDAVPVEAMKTELPKPNARLVLHELTVVPPGETRPTLQRVTVSIEPGQAVGVVGESASGKSSLARAVVGLWRPAAGEIRLGGARLDQYPEERLSDYIGYLPQEVALFEGTVAQNIARLQQTPDSGSVVEAATLAGAHEMILGLPKGYDTPVGVGGAKLSGGQKQRIGLARALFGAPVVVVLDEPNSNLDAPGSDAINAAIRKLKAQGRIVIIMAHRPAAIAECDQLLMIRQGQVVAFGPRDEVLRKIAANHTQLAVAPRQQAGA